MQVYDDDSRDACKGRYSQVGSEIPILHESKSIRISGVAAFFGEVAIPENIPQKSDKR